MRRYIDPQAVPGFLSRNPSASVWLCGLSFDRIGPHTITGIHRPDTADEQCADGLHPWPTAGWFDVTPAEFLAALDQSEFAGLTEAQIGWTFRVTFSDQGSPQFEPVHRPSAEAVQVTNQGRYVGHHATPDEAGYVALTQSMGRGHLFARRYDSRSPIHGRMRECHPCTGLAYCRHGKGLSVERPPVNPS